MKESGANWVLANIDVVGYYRVNYDQGNWDRLLNGLMTNHTVSFRATFHAQSLLSDYEHAS